MNRTGLYAFLTICCLFCSACGGDSDDPPRDNGGSPETGTTAEKPQKPATPEELGRAVADALIRNDLEGFLDLWLSVEDRIALAKASTLPEEKKQRFIESLAKEREISNDRPRSKYIKIAADPKWPDAVVDSVTADELEMKDGITRCDLIRVAFKGGAVLLIHGAHPAPAGWGIDEGVGYFPQP